MIKCILENGHETSFRHVTANTIIVNDKNQTLLIKRATDLTNGGKYALPGGFVDRDETVKEAAAREALEETGFEVEILQLLRIADNPDRPQEDRQNIDYVYIGKIKGGKISSDSEVSEVDWFDLNKLPDISEFAFDHYEDIQLYLKYLKERLALPVFGKI